MYNATKLLRNIVLSKNYVVCTDLIITDRGFARDRAGKWLAFIEREVIFAIWLQGANGFFSWVSPKIWAIGGNGT